jgi:hypothetical protein
MCPRCNASYGIDDFYEENQEKYSLKMKEDNDM